MLSYNRLFSVFQLGILIYLKGKSNAEQVSNCSVNLTLSKYGRKPVHINCYGLPNDNHSSIWYSPNNDILQNQTESTNTSTLQLTPPFNDEDAGIYTLKIFARDNITDVRSINIHLLPYATGDIDDVNGNKYKRTSLETTEGDDVTLECVRTGYPNSSISWLRADDTKTIELFGNESNVRINSEATKLSITKLKVQDRAHYVCIVSNIAGSINITTLVRVRSKLSPLYPVIGIFIELILTVFVIYCFKRKEIMSVGSSNAELIETNMYNREDKVSYARDAAGSVITHVPSEVTSRRVSAMPGKSPPFEDID